MEGSEKAPGGTNGIRRYSPVESALIVANHYLETDLEKLKAAASMGYARGKLVEEANRRTIPAPN